MMKKTKYLLVLCCLYFFTFMITNAKENTNLVDFDKKGSLLVTLKDNTDDGINGVNISLYHIANVDVENSNLVYKYTSDFKNCNVSLKKIDNIAKQLNGCINDEIKSLEEKTNEQGEANYNNLDLGLYLVVQKDKKKGYSSFESFLISIPKNENNKWNYSIKTFPKNEIYKEIDLTVIKEWNTTRKDIPNEVTINLYKDNLLIDSIKLNKMNDWKYTWNDLEKTDKYRVEEVNIPNGYTASYKTDGYVFTVVNTDTLAQTGQIFYPIIILFLMGLLCISVAVCINKKDFNE